MFHPEVLVDLSDEMFGDKVRMLEKRELAGVRPIQASSFPDWFDGGSGLRSDVMEWTREAVSHEM